MGQDGIVQDGIVVVTGAGSGIGRATAAGLLGAGRRVAALDRDPVALEAAGFGSGALLRTLDVTDEEAVDSAVEAIAAEGPIHGLVNSAGIAADMPLGQTTAELFRRILNVNVIGSFLLARAVAPWMERSGGGAIVHIASVSGMQGNMGRTAYGASKGAVIAMTKVMAVELAAQGIRVNAVAPGPVDTPMVKAMHTPAERENWLRHVPLGRYASPEEIAAAIMFLLDPGQSSYVTGHILAVDGGFASGGTIRPRPDPQQAETIRPS